MFKTPQNNIFILVLVLTLSLPAFAYNTTFDTGELLAPHQHQMGLESQFILSSPSATNFIAHYDLGATESTNYRFMVGGGTRMFETGGFFKFIPLPDYKYQPAIGAEAGIIYANSEGNHILGLRLSPLVSKNLDAEDFGFFTPYVAVPFGVNFSTLERSYPSQLVLGTSWAPSKDSIFKLLAEYGINMNAAFNYVTAGFAVPIDGAQNFPEEK
jgi:hypothetical protein